MLLKVGPHPDTSTRRLGQLLVERNWITGEQLMRAIQSQRLVGGRIGTCLLEMDVLSEEHLLDALSDQLNVPAIRIEELRAISHWILELLPPKVARRCLAVPFAATDEDVRVATLNVDNLAFLDEMTFCTGRKVRPYIANEVRLFEALERYYGFECPTRYGHLLDRLNRSKYLWDESAKILLGASENEVKVAWKEPEEVFGGQILHSAASRSKISQGGGRSGGSPNGGSPNDGSAKDGSPTNGTSPKSSWQNGGQDKTNVAFQMPRQPSSAQRQPLPFPTEPSPGLSRVATEPVIRESDPPRSSGVLTPKIEPPPVPDVAVPAFLDLNDVPSAVNSLDNVDQLLAQQSNYQKVGQILVQFMAHHFNRGLIFQLHQGLMHGWLGRGRELDGPRFQQLRIDLQQPSIFSSLIKGSEHYLGPLAPMPSHRTLATCWGGALPKLCIAVPIRVRDRTVCVLYVDQGDQPIAAESVDLLTRLAHKGAMAFEVCILQKKIRQS